MLTASCLIGNHSFYLDQRKHGIGNEVGQNSQSAFWWFCSCCIIFSLFFIFPFCFFLFRIWLQSRSSFRCTYLFISIWSIAATYRWSLRCLLLLPLNPRSSSKLPLSFLPLSSLMYLNYNNNDNNNRNSLRESLLIQVWSNLLELSINLMFPKEELLNLGLWIWRYYLSLSI